MELQNQLLAIERTLWTNDAAFYEAHLTEDALLVFAETGAITRNVAVAAIRKETAGRTKHLAVQHSPAASTCDATGHGSWVFTSRTARGFELADRSLDLVVEGGDDLVGVLFRVVESQAADREIDDFMTVPRSRPA